jgi:hypothetical protein
VSALALRSWNARVFDPRGERYKWIVLSNTTLAVLTGRWFFPQLISPPFRAGLHEAFAFAIVACLIAAAASWSRGGRYVDAQARLSAQPHSGLAGQPVASATRLQEK